VGNSDTFGFSDTAYNDYNINKYIKYDIDALLAAARKKNPQFMFVAQYFEKLK